jgi:hypothetical protein
MAALNGLQMAKLKASPIDYPEVADVGGRLRVFNEKITLAGQTTADTIAVARLPKGARVLYGVLTADTSLGTSTIAVGVAGTPGKYRTAATFTATNAPTLFGNAAAVGEPLASDEDVLITIATANLPGAGTLRLQIVFTVD